MSNVAHRGEINGEATDRFTLVHGAFGVIMGAIGVPMFAAVGVAIGWEFLERPLKDAFPQAFPHASQDRIPNAVCDAAAMITGWGVGRTARYLRLGR